MQIRVRMETCTWSHQFEVELLYLLRLISISSSILTVLHTPAQWHIPIPRCPLFYLKVRSRQDLRFIFQSVSPGLFSVSRNTFSSASDLRADSGLPQPTCFEEVVQSELISPRTSPLSGFLTTKALDEWCFVARNANPIWLHQLRNLPSEFLTEHEPSNDEQ